MQIHITPRNLTLTGAIHEFVAEKVSHLEGHGETILVVDDEPAVRDVCRQILLALGLRVRVATDGHSALEVLGDPSAHIAGVITDLHMPRMDGIELTRVIRRRWPDLGVILSSGRVDKADAAILAELGISARWSREAFWSRPSSRSSWCRSS